MYNLKFNKIVCFYSTFFLLYLDNTRSQPYNITMKVTQQDIEFMRVDIEIEQDVFVRNFGYEDFKKRKSQNRLHKMNYHTLQFVSRGKGEYTLNDHLYSIEKNDLFYLPPNDLLLYKHNPNDPYKYYWLGLHGKRVPDLIKLFGLSKSFPIIQINNPEELLETFHALISHDKLGNIKLKSYIYKIFDILCDNRDLIESKEDFTMTKNHLLNDILDYIHNNYPQNDFQIPNISEIFHLTEIQLYRLFSSFLGMSPKQYIVKYRMEKALEMLKNGASVTQTYINVGYSDIYYFSKQFKNYFGYSPSKTHKNSLITK